MLQARSWLPRTEGSVRLGFARRGEQTALDDAAPGRRRARALSQAGRRRRARGRAAQHGRRADRRRPHRRRGDARRRRATRPSPRPRPRRSTARATATPTYRVTLDAGAGRPPRLAAAADHPVRPVPARSAHRGRRLRATRRFLAVETLIFGRAAMGEDVQRGACRDAWRIRRDGALVFADTLRAGWRHRRRARPAGARSMARAPRPCCSMSAPDAAARLDEARALLESAQSDRRGQHAGTACWSCARWRATAARCSRRLAPLVDVR